MHKPARIALTIPSATAFCKPRFAVYPADSINWRYRFSEGEKSPADAADVIRAKITFQEYHDIEYIFQRNITTYTTIV